MEISVGMEKPNSTRPDRKGVAWATQGYLRAESMDFGFAVGAGSRRKIVSPSFMRSRRSRAMVSK
jgi:hypothetical protein